MEAICYYRRSTKTNQFHSLGNQRANVRAFCERENITILKEWEESASGRDDNREGLLSAIANANFHNCALVVWSVCRLGRNCGSTISLLESNLKIIIAEHGLHADPTLLALQCVLATAEVKLTSKRIRIGMAAAAARGSKIGNPNMVEMRKASAIKRRENADKWILRVGHLIDVYINLGLTQKQAAEMLNDSGVKTPRGKTWSQQQVYTTRKRWNILMENSR